MAKPGRIIGVIPARGGSKGLANKNLLPLLGKPLIYYVIQAALSSTILESLYVSTDSVQIANAAASMGAEVILHPAQLSSDSAPTFGVIANAVAHLQEVGVIPEIIVTMRATSPLLIPADIDDAIALLISNPQADSVIAVTESPVHPQRVLRIREDGNLVSYEPTPEKLFPMRRQTFPPVFVRNGAIYASRFETIDAGGLWLNHNLPYKMPRERSVNINDELDFIFAKAVMQHVRDL